MKGKITPTVIFHARRMLMISFRSDEEVAFLRRDQAGVVAETYMLLYSVLLVDSELTSVYVLPLL